MAVQPTKTIILGYQANDFVTGINVVNDKLNALINNRVKNIVKADGISIERLNGNLAAAIVVDRKVAVGQPIIKHISSDVSHSVFRDKDMEGHPIHYWTVTFRYQITIK